MDQGRGVAKRRAEDGECCGLREGAGRGAEMRGVGGSLGFISVAQRVEGGASERRSFALKYELRAIGVERRPNKKDEVKSWTRRERGRSRTGRSLGAQPSRVAISSWVSGPWAESRPSSTFGLAVWG